jgi:hypothetical protein
MIFVYIIGFFMNLLISSNLNQHEYGQWEYSRVVINDTLIDASALNECGHRDVILFKDYDQKIIYEFEEEVIVGYLAGVSDHEFCGLDLLTFEYTVFSNSCTTNWIKSTTSSNYIYIVNSGVVVKYEIDRVDFDNMKLSKVKEVVYHIGSQPDEIHLRRVKL